MSFLADYQKLFDSCPHPCFSQVKVENCAYADFIEGGKNCYYVFDAGEVEDVYYSEWIGYSKDCSDCSHVLNCELCYECVDSTECYNSENLIDCKNVRDSAFCYGCAQCSDCFMCSGLRNKKYCVENKELSKGEYEKVVSEMKLFSREELFNKLMTLSADTPRKNLYLVQCENCIGDFVHYSKDIYYGFGVYNERDGCYIFDFGSFAQGADNFDCYKGGDDQLCYECAYVSYCFNCDYLFCCDHCSDCFYCTECSNCKNCFGCTYLKHKQFYILNEPYTEKEYFEKISELRKEIFS